MFRTLKTEVICKKKGVNQDDCICTDWCLFDLNDFSIYHRFFVAKEKTHNICYGFDFYDADIVGANGTRFQRKHGNTWILYHENQQIGQLSAKSDQYLHL